MIGYGNIGKGIVQFLHFQHPEVGIFWLDANKGAGIGSRYGIPYSEEHFDELTHTVICVPTEVISQPEFLQTYGVLLLHTAVIIHTTPPYIGWCKKNLVGIPKSCYIPIFSRERCVYLDLLSPRPILFGSDMNLDKVPSELLQYVWLFRQPFLQVSTTVAEIIKLATNAIRYHSIQFWNDIYSLLMSHDETRHLDAVIKLLNPSKVLCEWEGGEWGWKKEKFGSPPAGACLPRDLRNFQRSISGELGEAKLPV